jgi:hypothetical protein
MSYTYEELKPKTVAQLREIAAGIQHEAVKGASQLNKEHLLTALCLALGIDKPQTAENCSQRNSSLEANDPPSHRLTLASCLQALDHGTSSTKLFSPVKTQLLDPLFDKKASPLG